MRDRHRRLAGGRDAVDVGGFDRVSAIALSAASACNWILRHVGDDAEPGGFGGADNGDASYAIVSFYVALGST
jgi:hypothetical protein